MICETTGKIRHEDAGAAWGHIGDLIRQGRATRERWNAYKCDACEGWHVGHRPGTLSKDIRRAIKASSSANRRNRRRRR